MKRHGQSGQCLIAKAKCSTVYRISQVPVPCSCWVEHSQHVYNSQTTYATDTKLAKSTALHDLVIVLEAGSCKPAYSIHRYDGHNYVRYETRKGYLIVTWHHDVTIILASKWNFLHPSRTNSFIVVSQARLWQGRTRAMLLLVTE